MKTFFLISLPLLMMSCGAPTQKPIATNPTKASSGEMILLGKINRANLQTDALTSWFNREYEMIQVEPQWGSDLQDHLEGLEIKVFMGTWCEDSQREIPHFFKLLDALEFDQRQLEMYAMSEEKTTPQNFEKDLEIHHVPTIIFFKNGEEINRFVELPVSSLATDIAKIIKGETYRHAYE